MDKERYVDPLKDWERKNKSSPNFAFLIVEPKARYEEVKRNLLESLLLKPIPLAIKDFDPFYFLYIFSKSPIK